MTTPPIGLAPELDLIAMDWLRERWPLQLGTVDPGTDSEVLLVRDETPVDIRELLVEHGHFVSVHALPGRTTRHEVIAPLDFHVFALTTTAASNLSREIDAELLGRPYIRTMTGASLQGVISRLSPVTVPWADAAVRRYMSSYTVTARR